MSTEPADSTELRAPVENLRSRVNTKTPNAHLLYTPVYKMATAGCCRYLQLPPAKKMIGVVAVRRSTQRPDRCTYPTVSNRITRISPRSGTDPLTLPSRSFMSTNLRFWSNSGTFNEHLRYASISASASLCYVPLDAIQGFSRKMTRPRVGSGVSKTRGSSWVGSGNVGNRMGRVGSDRVRRLSNITGWAGSP